MRDRRSPKKELKETLYQLNLRDAKERDERAKKQQEEDKRIQAEATAKMLAWANTQIKKQVIKGPETIGKKVSLDTGEAGATKTKYPDTGGG